MNSNEFNPEGSDFVDIGNGRTDYAPESGVGPEGRFIYLPEQEQLRAEVVAQGIAHSALHEIEVSESE